MTIETDRLIAPEQGARVDEQLDRAIRPKSLEDYLGQRVVCEQMEIFPVSYTHLTLPTNREV